MKNSDNKLIDFNAYINKKKKQVKLSFPTISAHWKQDFNGNIIK